MEAERGIVKSFVLPPAVCASAEQFAPLAVISRVRRSGMGVNCGGGAVPEIVGKILMGKGWVIQKECRGRKPGEVWLV